MPVSRSQLTAFTREHTSKTLHLVGPPHLAGPGDPRHVTHALLAADWISDAEPATPEVPPTSPDQTTHQPIVPPADPNDVWWRITTSDWFAEFTRRPPVEIVAGFTDALLAPAPEEAPDPWEAFRASGWTINVDARGHSRAVSPDKLVTVFRLRM